MKSVTLYCIEAHNGFEVGEKYELTQFGSIWTFLFGGEEFVADITKFSKKK